METLTTTLTTVLDVVKSSMGLLTEFPMNVFLGGSIFAMGLGLFRKGKKVAR